MDLTFSIIIPTFNRANLIRKVVATVLAQSFDHFELLIVDDGSTDDTETVVGKIDDPRIRYFKILNGERGAARNFGTKNSLGRYLNYFDSDDLMYPSHLHKAHEFISRNDNPAFFHFGYDYKNPYGEVVSEVNNFDGHMRSILFDNLLSCNGVFLRRDIALEHPFEEDRTLASSEDWELWIRLFSRFPFLYSNEITTSVVQHDNRSLRTIASEKIEQRDLLLIRNLKADAAVMKTYRNDFGRFVSDRYTFFMLNYASQRKISKVLGYAWKAVKLNPRVVMNRRFLTSIKKLLVG